MRPDCSLPSRIATRFTGSFCQIVSAHSRGFTTGTTTVRSRALAPTTQPQSAIASSRVAQTRALERISSAPAARAVAASLGNSARGRTSASSESPIVRIARAVAPMLPGCEVSTSTIRTGIRTVLGALIQRGQLANTLGLEERIDGSHAAVVAAVLEVLRKNLRNPVHLGVRPKVRVEP